MRSALLLSVLLCACAPAPREVRPTLNQAGGHVAVTPVESVVAQTYIPDAPRAPEAYRPDPLVDTPVDTPVDQPIWIWPEAARVAAPEPGSFQTPPSPPAVSVAAPVKVEETVAPQMGGEAPDSAELPAVEVSPAPQVEGTDPPRVAPLAEVAPSDPIPAQRDVPAAGAGLLPSPRSSGAEFGSLQLSRTLRSGPRDRRVVALTFDDGPWPQQTGAVLDILVSRDVQATFFMTGLQAQALPAVVRQVQQAGHDIGAHTWSHPASTRRLNADQSRWEVDNTSRILEQTTGEPVRLMRPSGGGLASGPALAADQAGQQVVLWNVDSRDWAHGATAQGVLRGTLAQVQPGSIILMHDGGGRRSATLEALPELIDTLKGQGYEFVKVSQLLP